MWVDPPFLSEITQKHKPRFFANPKGQAVTKCIDNDNEGPQGHQFSRITSILSLC